MNPPSTQSVSENSSPKAMGEAMKFTKLVLLMLIGCAVGHDTCNQDEDESRFFYETNIHLEVISPSGDSPQCSSSEISEIADVLSEAWRTSIAIDNRLEAVFQLETEICNSLPPATGRLLSTYDQNQERRHLDFVWNTFEQGSDSSRYLFNFDGIGDCRWCKPQDANSDSSRFLRQGILSAKDSSKVAEYDSTHYEAVEESRRLSKVEQFVLYKTGNSLQSERITPVDDFAIIDLKKHQQHLTLVAEGSEDVHGIRFAVDGNENYRTEMDAPFAVNGRDRSSNTKFFDFPEIQDVGTHTVVAQPLSSTGEPDGEALKISFLVVDSSQHFEPEVDPELINVLEEDLSFHLSKEVNNRFFGEFQHCLEEHLAYVRVDLYNIQADEHVCVPPNGNIGDFVKTCDNKADLRIPFHHEGLNKNKPCYGMKNTPEKKLCEQIDRGNRFIWESCQRECFEYSGCQNPKGNLGDFVRTCSNANDLRISFHHEGLNKNKPCYGMKNKPEKKLCEQLDRANRFIWESCQNECYEYSGCPPASY